MRAAVWVFLAAALFGTTGTAHALSPAGTSATSLGLVRVALGGLLLGALVLTRSTWPTVRRSVTASQPRIVIVVAALAVIAYQPLFFTGAQLNGVAVGAVLALGSAPVVAGLIDAVVVRRPPTRRWLLATALALIGMVCVVGLPDPTSGTVSAGGIAASVGAGASYAVYAAGARSLITSTGLDSRLAMGVVFGLAGATSLPLLVTQDVSWVLTGRGLVVTVWLAVATMAIAYLLLGRGLALLPTSTVATLTLAEPLTATVLSVTVLGQPFGMLAVVGLVVLCWGLVVLTVPLRARRPRRRSVRPLDA